MISRNFGKTVCEIFSPEGVCIGGKGSVKEK
jgi:hypothetical protein